MTADIQGNYPNFKQNLAEKENFVISKVNGRQPLFNKSCLRAARFQKLTTVCQVKNNESGNKNLTKKLWFQYKYSQETRLKEFWGNLDSHGLSREAEW